MRTLKDIRAHFNGLYAKAEEGSIKRICYGNIYQELRWQNTKREGAEAIKFLRNAAPETDKPIYQEALDLLTSTGAGNGKHQGTLQ